MSDELEFAERLDQLLQRRHAVVGAPLHPRRLSLGSLDELRYVRLRLGGELAERAEVPLDDLRNFSIAATHSRGLL